MTSETEDAARSAMLAILSHFGPFGVTYGKNGGFKAAHDPEVAPLYFGVSVFDGLIEAEISHLERELPYPIPEQDRGIIPDPYRDFLGVTNGLHLLKLSLYGNQSRTDAEVGAPFDLRTPQLEKPQGSARTAFVIGSINGQRYSQGTLLLNPDGSIAMVHRDTGVVGAAWGNLAMFLSEEIPRRLAAHDGMGRLEAGFSGLPGDTTGWEESGRLASLKRKRDASLLGRVVSRVRQGVRR